MKFNYDKVCYLVEDLCEVHGIDSTENKMVLEILKELENVARLVGLLRFSINNANAEISRVLDDLDAGGEL